MKKFLLILVFGIFHYQLFAQTAEDALSEFDWLTNYVERNYPGYKYGWEESPTNKKASEFRLQKIGSNIFVEKNKASSFSKEEVWRGIINIVGRNLPQVKKASEIRLQKINS